MDKFQTFMRQFSGVMNKLVLFFGIMGAFALVVMSTLTLYRVFLSEKVVRDINGPVARFVANVDFKTRTVKFDTTFSKTVYAEPKISIWRFGDGKVVKSSTAEEIAKNEVVEYTFLEPGTYMIGYSLIDKNDLSDEAVCVVTFTDKKAKMPEQNSISSDCGKSFTSYNDDSSVFEINNVKSAIRQAYFFIGVAALLLAGSYLFNRVFARFFLV